MVMILCVIGTFCPSFQGLTENQNRLLYMIDLYTHKATGADDKNEWIRKPVGVP
jgi:hypothetical protein